VHVRLLGECAAPTTAIRRRQRRAARTAFWISGSERGARTSSGREWKVRAQVEWRWGWWRCAPEAVQHVVPSLEDVAERLKRDEAGTVLEVVARKGMVGSVRAISAAMRGSRWRRSQVAMVVLDAGKCAPGGIAAELTSTVEGGVEE
jgi:hypothetical protein